MTAGAQLADAAESLVGSRFRLHGRDPATGLDCVGLLAAALGACGRDSALPGDYTLRMRDIAHFTARAGEFGFAVVEDAGAPGDVVIVVAGPCQFHFAITTADGGAVHADAGLRRVVRVPGLPAGALVGRWRLAEHN